MTQSSLWQPSDIMAADGNTENEPPKRRGRIPQSAWPQILERYRSGATLSAIAREFDCTPSAISYIVRKAEAAGVEPVATTAIDETSSDEGAVAKTEPKTARKAASQSAPQTDQQTKVAKAPSKPEAAASVPPAPAPQPAPHRETLHAPVKAKVTPPTPVALPDSNGSKTAQTTAGDPVDTTEVRLRDASTQCLSVYRTWRQSPGEGSIQALNDAVHELRKVLARIEIDMSASRRDEQVTRPIPIPTHRASRYSR